MKHVTRYENIDKQIDAKGEVNGMWYCVKTHYMHVNIHV